MEEVTSDHPQPAPQPQPRSAQSTTISWLRDLCISVVIAIVVILFLYQPVKVEGTSMMPSLIDQERIFINKFEYRFGLSDISRGDMVVFWFPGDPTKSYIKRVIGVPGDTVEVNDGTVIVNGEPLAESYVPREYRDHVSMPRRVIPQDQFFVLGDHRSSSNDSRSWGMVPRHFIYGKAVFVYWPLDRIGVLH
ncbi:MAG TPA: signal peptidase I [Bryobacteraceae bacterium]|nr:signal peptidase I [Bryobacteraceae bacterium]